MSDEECGVCLGDYCYDDGPCDFYDVKWVKKARKQHQCEACRGVIEIGATYHRFTGKFDGDVFTQATCSDCQHILDAFTCEGDSQVPASELWSSMREVVFPDMTTACLAKVEDEHARETLRMKWMTWKGLK